MSALLAVMSLINVIPAYSWWDNAWKYQQKLTFDNSGQKEEIKDIPILIKLSPANFDCSKVKSDGADLRFIASDDRTVLKYYIHKWDIKGESLVWVRVPHIPASSKDGYIYLYCGNPAAGSIQDAAGTYPSTFRAVWHLDEASGNILDSTAHNTTGVAVSKKTDNLTYGEPGKVGASVKFSGGYFDCGNNASVKSFDSAISFGAWVKPAGTGHSGIIDKFDRGDSPDRSYALDIGDQNEFNGVVVTPSGGGCVYSNKGPSVLATVGQWYFLVVTYDGTKVKFYINNSEVGSADGASYVHESEISLVIGAKWYGGIDNPHRFSGNIDEAFIIADGVNAAWINAWYNMVQGTFVGYGPVSTADKPVAGDVKTDVPVIKANATAPGDFKIDKPVAGDVKTNVPVIKVNAATPGDFKIDDATLKCLAFRWFIEGDDNGNATVKAAYRKKGEKEWRLAQPMLRINREIVDRATKEQEFVCGNLFAGSIMFLDPDTEYEANFVLNDPDGGKAEKTVTVRTRGEPKAPQGGATLHVYPADYTGSKLSPSFDNPQKAAESANPGDVVLIHRGVYQGPFRIEKGGTPAKPIVLRGENRDSVILEGPSYAGAVISCQKVDNLMFEDMTIRKGSYGIFARFSNDIVVRRCHIYDVLQGISSYYSAVRGWHIADNEVMGKAGPVNSDRLGINLAGRGNVICYNRVSQFPGDCITICGGDKAKDWRNPPNMAVDIYNNELSHAGDDGIEADYGYHNIRVFDNLLHDNFQQLSVQPVYGGPCYFIRNLTYNGNSLKFANWPSGVLYFHNTLVGSRFETGTPAQVLIVRNNISMGPSNDYCLALVTVQPSTTSLDYDAYFRGVAGSDPATGPSFYVGLWTNPRAAPRYVSSLKTIEQLYRAMHYEQHGLFVDMSIFQNPDQHDYRLKPDAPTVDRGEILPNINDNFKGKAPDLGCYELGETLPHYGPRMEEKPNKYVTGIKKWLIKLLH